MKRLSLLLLLPTLLFAELNFHAEYTNDLLGNPVGGLRPGFTNASAMYFFLDYEKECWDLHVSAAYLSGKSLTEDYIGNAFFVAQNFGGNTARFIQLWAQRRFSWGRLKAGRLATGEEFATSPLYYYYVSWTYNGNPISLPLSLPFSVLPFSNWGAFGELNLPKCVSLKLGAYIANKRVWENRFHGINFTFDNEKGLLLIAEANYSPKRGNYKVGVYTITHDSGNSGIYFTADHILYRRNEMTVTPWATLTFLPKKSNEVTYFFSAGIACDGWLKCRPKDSTNFAIARGSFGARGQTYEINIELNHWFNLWKDWYITPDLQWVINPSGLGTIPNALVLGCQVTAHF